MKSRMLALFSLAIVGALLLAACGGGAPSTPAASQGDAVAGKTKFEGTCSSCHGMEAKGMPNLGKDLTTSQFTKGLSDKDLVAFVIKGRPSSDPANTTGVDMPPRGGNPALTENDFYDIVAYIRTLEQ